MNFVKQLHEINSQGYMIISIYIKSLLVNITVGVSVDYLRTRLQKFRFSHLEIEEFIWLTRICLNYPTILFKVKLKTACRNQF